MSPKKLLRSKSADGGEPGKAYLALFEVLSSGDMDKIREVVPPEDLDQMKELGLTDDEVLEFLTLTTPTEVEIVGGTFPGYNRDPVSDPETYASGLTDFTANIWNQQSTPAMYEVARIRFQTLGGGQGAIGIGLSPNGGLVESASYTLAAATTQPMTSAV